MLKIIVRSWDLKSIATSRPDLYKALFEADRRPRGERIAGIADENYTDFEGFINDVEALPGEIMEFAKFSPVPALKLVQDNGDSCRGLKLTQAMQAHQVHLPGNELLKLTLVEVREDCCTEALQDDLNEGWRIVAVIPRAGQRRPDYVLGKVQ
jgi:hypothetical protein